MFCSMTDHDPQHRLQHSREILDRLLAGAMRFIQRAAARAEAEPETTPEMADIYDRLSSSVRRTIALKHHLGQAPTRTQQRTAPSRKLIRTVEDAISHPDRFFRTLPSPNGRGSG